MPPPRRGRTATNRAPPGSNLNFYPVRNWRLGPHLIVIGRHTYRTLESYDWEPLDAMALDLAAARGAMRLDQKKPLTLPDRPSDITPDLEDEQTIVVSRQPIQEQMAESITVISIAMSRTRASPNIISDATTASVPTQTSNDNNNNTNTNSTSRISTTPTPTPIIDHDDLSIPDSWQTAPDSDEESSDDNQEQPKSTIKDDQRATVPGTTGPPSLPDSEMADYLSAHACKWLAAEFQDMAKDRAAEHDENSRFRDRLTSTIDTIQNDLRSLTDKTGDALIRLIQENRLIKSLIDTILSELRAPRPSPPTQDNSYAHSDDASTQAVDIPPFAKCPPDNTPASGSGSEGSTPGPDNPPPPTSSRPNRTKSRGKKEDTTPEDTAMKFNDPFLNKGCKRYSNDNLSDSIHAAPASGVKGLDAKTTKPRRCGKQTISGRPKGTRLEEATTERDTFTTTENPPKPLDNPTPPPHPFRTPIEDFTHMIDRRLDEGTLTPAGAHQMRITFQRHYLEVTAAITIAPLPHGTISPLPDPDTNLPDSPPPPTPSPPPAIELTTTPDVIDLITPEPALYDLTNSPTSSPTPPPEKREYSPGREELAQLCGQAVHRNKGRQAVQRASPVHNTEDSLRAIPTHAPASSGIFQAYSPEIATTLETTTGHTSAKDTPIVLEFGDISPPIHTDSTMSNNLPANRNPANQNPPSLP